MLVRRNCRRALSLNRIEMICGTGISIGEGSVGTRGTIRADGRRGSRGIGRGTGDLRSRPVLGSGPGGELGSDRAPYRMWRRIPGFSRG